MINSQEGTGAAADGDNSSSNPQRARNAFAEWLSVLRVAGELLESREASPSYLQVERGVTRDKSLAYWIIWFQNHDLAV